jgi:hypothetical protein
MPAVMAAVCPKLPQIDQDQIGMALRHLDESGAAPIQAAIVDINHFVGQAKRLQGGDKLPVQGSRLSSSL